MRGQSLEAQAERLANGACPVHGLPLTQAGSFFRGRTLVQCTRKDCAFYGSAETPLGPVIPWDDPSSHPDCPGLPDSVSGNVPRELVLRLSRHKLGGNTFRLILAVAGNTYGWALATWDVARSEIRLATGLSESSLRLARDEALAAGILTCETLVDLRARGQLALERWAIKEDTPWVT